MSVFEALLEFVRVALSELLVQTSQAWRLFADRLLSPVLDFTAAMSDLRFYDAFQAFILILPNTLLAIELFINDLGSIPAQTIISTLLRTFQTGPPGWNNSIITRKQAFLEFSSFILVTGYDVVSLHVPVTFKWWLKIKSLVKLLLKINAGGTILEKIVDYLVKGVFKRLFFMLIQLVLLGFKYVGLFFFVLLYGFFVEYCSRGVILAPLSQKTPRKKVHTVQGEIIRRREPGGSPP